MPFLALTVLASTWTTGRNAIGIEGDVPGTGFNDEEDLLGRRAGAGAAGPRERETMISQEIPVKVLHETAVEGLHEPRCRDPDVHIILPSLGQLKSISERFTRLATPSLSAPGNTNTNTTNAPGAGSAPKLELSANMHGALKLAIHTDSLRISSHWTDLLNPPLDPAQLSSQTDFAQLPSERMRAAGSEDEGRGWARVRIDGRDWGRVLSVGRLSPKVVACMFSLSPLFFFAFFLWD